MRIYFIALFLIAIASPNFGQDILTTIYGDTIEATILKQDLKFFYVNQAEKPGEEIKYPKSIIKDVYRKDFIQEDAQGNWMYQEVVEYDSAIIKPSQIIQNVERWLLDKRTLFNTAIDQSVQMPENVLLKDDNKIKGFIHGKVQRSFMEQYLMRIHIKVEVRPGRYRVTFMEATPLAAAITGVAALKSSQLKPLTADDVRTNYSKQRGEFAFVVSIKRLLSQVKTEAIKSYSEENDDW
jgi:hypothetical protein